MLLEEDRSLVGRGKESEVVESLSLTYPDFSFSGVLERVGISIVLRESSKAGLEWGLTKDSGASRIYWRLILKLGAI